MKKLFISFISAILLTCFVFLASSNAGTGQDGEIRAGVDKKTLMKKISALQIPFIENQGQIKPVLNKAEGAESVRFYASTFAGTVFVTDKGEIVYSLIKSEVEKMRRWEDEKLKGTTSQPLNLSTSKLPNSNTKAIVLRETLESPEQSSIKGINKSETKVNYFIGEKNNWRTNIQTWQEVSIGEVYKGVELKLKAYGKNVEKLFTVYPEGNVNDIKLKIEGAKGLKVSKDGELEAETELGVVKMTKPVAYQEINGKRVEVDASYELKTQNSELIYSFKVGEYDNTKELIIDPLLASTFIGGSGQDFGIEIALDSTGNIIVAGG